MNYGLTRFKSGGTVGAIRDASTVKRCRVGYAFKKFEVS